MIQRALAFLGLVFLLTAITSGNDGPVRPNIVLVVVDDLRFDDLGCAGHPFAQTSNIDRLSAEGARFRNAFCTTPLCSPSRATILTGQYAHTHGIFDNTDRSPQSHQLKTFPQVLQNAGYETAFFGKWHMGNDNTVRPGFERWYALQGQGTSFDSVVNDDGQEVQTQGYVTDVLNESCVQFIQRARRNPFLVVLAHKAIHPETSQASDGKLSDPTASNFIPASRHEHLFPSAKIPRRPSYGVPPIDKPALMQKLAGLEPLGAATVSSDISILNRLRMLAAVDEGIGMIRDALAASGKLDETLIMVIGDHGYFYGEHGLSVERRLAYEESIRIPMVVRYPPLAKPQSEPRQMALTVDIAPTLVELAGIPSPSRFQGQSLIPLLQQAPPADWRKSFLVEYYSDTVFPRINKMGYDALRTERWKYIQYRDQTGMDELYDLESDPYELRNLIEQPEMKQPLTVLRSELNSQLKKSGG